MSETSTLYFTVHSTTAKAGLLMTSALHFSKLIHLLLKFERLSHPKEYNLFSAFDP